MSKTKIPIEIRRMVARRAGWHCEYCKSQERFAPQNFTLDHIIPEIRGGSHSLENLAFACQGCNGCKFDKTGLFDLVSGQFALFFNPRTQIWADHFGWSEDFTQLIGLSAHGRVTIIGLKLNRKILIGLREFLHKTGEHPPKI